MKKSKTKLLEEGDDLFYAEKYEEAIQKYEAAVAIDKDYEQAYYAWGEALLAMPDRFDEAVNKYREGIAVAKDKADGYVRLGAIFKAQNRYEEAIEQYKAAIDLDENDEYAYYDWAETLLALPDRFEEGVEVYKKGIAVSEDQIIGYNDLARIYKEQNRYEEAIEQYKAIIVIDEQDPFAYYDWAETLLAMPDRFEEAIEVYKKGISVSGDQITGYNNLAGIYKGRNRYEEAIQQYKAIIALDENNAYGYYDWAGTLLAISDGFDEAVEIYRKGIAVAADKVTGYSLLAGVYKQRNRNEEAIEQYKTIIAIDESNEFAYYDWADTLLAMPDRFEEAVQVYRKGIAFSKNKPDSYYSFGEIFRNRKLYEEAIEQYKAALAIEKNSADAHNSWGLTLNAQKKYNEAIEHYKTALAIDKDYVFAYLNWGLTLEAQKKYDEAIEQYKAALAIDKDYADAYNYLGLALNAQKKYNEAIEQYKAALAINKDYIDTFINWGLTLEAQRKYDEAIEQYKAALAIEKNSADAYNYLGLVLNRQKRHDEAIEQYKAALAIEKDYVYAYINWGLALDAQKKYEEAIEQYKAALAIKKDYVEAYINWGAALNVQKKYEEAIEQYKAALAIDKDSVDAYNGWGLTLNAQKKYEEAIERYKAALAIEKDSADAYTNWGLTLEAQRKYEEAIEKYKTALAIDEDSVYAYYNWGFVLTKQEEYTSAIEKYSQAIQKDEKYVFSYLDCALALQNLGRNDEALKMYQDAILADPNNPDVYRELGWFFHIALREYGKAEEALRRAIKVAKDDRDLSNIYNDIGNVLLDRKKYSAAIENYKEASRLDLQSVYPPYNIALALKREAKYREASVQWKEALRKYAQAEQISNAFDFNISGWMTYEVFQNHELGVSLYRLGLEIDPENLDLHQSLLECYMAQKDNLEYSGDGLTDRQKFLAAQARDIIQKGKTAEESSNLKTLRSSIERIPAKNVRRPLRGVGSFSADSDSERIRRSIDMYSRAMQTFSRLEDLLTRKLENADKQKMEEKARAQFYLRRARANLTVEKYEDARRDAQKAIELDDQSHDAYATLGAVLMRLEEYKSAIVYFKDAVALEVDDFGYRSNLAEAYRKAGMLDEAKKEYELILKISPHHLDSIIGMGETYAAMGDGLKDGSKSVDSEEMYMQAIERYSKALSVAESDDASKVLNLREIAAIRYARGYARVMLFESQSHPEEKILREAQRDFELVPVSDKNYQKARRSASKIHEKLRPFSQNNLEQRAGALVVSFAIFVFLVGQFMFLVGQPTRIPVAYTFGNGGIEALKGAGVPEDLLVNLGLLLPQRFASQQELMEAVHNIAGDAMTLDIQRLIVANIETVPASIGFQPVDVGYYALFTFGPLIFVVAGAYLQQISRLKFAGIEIEKSSVDQISTSTSLGIRR